MKKRSRKAALALVFALVFATVATGTVVSYTYAKYTGKVESSGTLKIADWQFEEDNPTQTLNIDLAETVKAGTVAEGFVAPGASGSFSFKVSNKNTDVAVDYVIEVGEMTDKPAGLTITAPENASGTLAANAEEQTLTFTWEWAYEGNDEDDMAKAGTDLVIPVTITGTQHNPNEAID